MLRLVYETHSTTTDNEAGLATGWNHGHLSKAGERQAQALGDRRRRPRPAVVFASDLARAARTAELAFGGSGVPILLDWRLRECDYGELTGARAARLDAERATHVDVPWRGGESYRDVVARTERFLVDVRDRWAGSTVVVIAHSANRWALQHLLDGIPLAELVGAPFDWQPGWEFSID